MKRSDFLEKQQAYKKRLGRINYFLLGGIVIGAGTGFISANFFPPDAQRTISFLGGLFGVYIGAFIGLIWIKKFKKESDLFCPSCKKALTGGLGQIAIASGNCGNCGAEVIEK